MSKPLRVITRAKVNLSLEVIRRRADGYHEIETILQTVDLRDHIEIEITRDARVTLTCSDPNIPTDETNLCWKALCAMRRHAGEALGARIRLEKRIPTGAGLGGGSSNAGGVMLAVARLLHLDVSMTDLERTAASVGSDVPFMLHGGTMLARGKGEKLVPLEAVKSGYFVIVKPTVNISTDWVYGNYNFALTKHRPRINLNAVNSVLARFPRATMTFRNALEDVVCPAYPDVSGVLDELLSTRPRFASMTGSGSALYAVYESEAKASDTAERFSARGYFSSVVEPAKRAVEILE